MHAMQLSAVDANLLVALHALLEERSVASAARRLALSPSATSHALARLRELLGDALLVRAGRALTRTPRAEQLRAPLARLVAEMEAILKTPGSLVPAALVRAFRVATTDHVQFVLLRQLDAALRREAPLVDLYFVPLPPNSAAALRDGTMDVAIGVFDEPPPDVTRQPLFEDQLVSVVRAGHPALLGRLTPRRFAELEHVLVAPNGSPRGLLDKQLAALGLGRRVARTVPTFLDAPFLVASSDHIVSLPARLVVPLLSLLRLSMVDAPLPLPGFTLSAIWHRRHDADPEHVWFRELLARAVAELEPLSRVLHQPERRSSRKRSKRPSSRPQVHRAKAERQG
jgi:DNA-binding transcriptional LysR family regulator